MPELSELGLLEPIPVTFSVSALAFNFDGVTTNPDISRADEIKVLCVKNKKPPKNSQEEKPPGIGTPTGGQESKESLMGAVARETEDETGYAVKEIIGKLFVFNKHRVHNEIHLYLIEVQDWQGKVRERDEVDWTFDNWSLSLRQIFQMPAAQDAHGNNRNPDGFYFSHRKRLYQAIEAMLLAPEKLEDGAKIARWVQPHREYLMDAMADLEKAGLLDDFLPDEDIGEEEDQ